MDRYGSLWQDVFVSGKKGETLVLAGWGKAVALDSSENARRPNRAFSLQACVYHTDGTTEWFNQKFNDDSKDWQYLAGVIVPKKDYWAVKVQAVYADNTSVAYFSDIQLYKEEFGHSYEYDKDGNIKNAIELNSEISKFDYDNNQNLIGITTPRGGKFTYEYSKDGKNNLVKANTETGVNYTYDYSSKGRPIKLTREKDELKITGTMTYQNNDNFTKSITNENGYETINEWDSKTGILLNSKDNIGGEISYGYDNFGKRNQVKIKMNDNEEIIKNTTFQKDKIRSFNQNGYKFNFQYDAWGNRNTVSIIFSKYSILYL